MEITNEPKFILRISKTDKSQTFSCLGIQLAQILQCILDEISNYIWYVSDIDYFNKEKNIYFDTSKSLCKMTSNELIDNAKQVEQFLSGVFIAISVDTKIDWINQIAPITETDEIMQIKASELEIRAFDTSYFEIYGMNKNIEAKLKSCFPIVILGHS